MNKVLKISLFLFVIVYMFSCQENDEGIGEPQILLEIISPKFHYFHEVWLIASKTNGEIILTERLADDSTVVLHAPKGFTDETFNITILNVQQSSNTNIYTVETYLNIKPDQWLHLGNISEGKPYKGNTAFSITGISGFRSASASTIDRTALLFGDGGVSTANLNLDMYQNTSNVVLSVLFTDKAPVYNIVKGAQVGSSYILDVNEFKPYDHSVSFSNPENKSVFLWITGVNSDEDLKASGYTLYRLATSEGLTNYNGYYIDGYKYYRTYFGCWLGSVYYVYSKLGEPVTKHEIPDFEFEVIKDNISDFEYTLSGEFDYRMSFWRYYHKDESSEDLLSWYVYGDAKDTLQQIMHEIPAQIAELHPFIDKNKLIYQETSFFDYVNGNSLNDYIEKRYKTNKINNEIFQETHMMNVKSEHSNGRFSTDHYNPKNIKEWWKLFEQ